MKVVLKVDPAVSSAELNALFASAWVDHVDFDAQPILDRALVYVCAYEEERLVGFAKVVGDGAVHGFLLDPTVARDRQRTGIGSQLVSLCADEARRKGVEWLHVDFVSALKPFYEALGFRHTEAGVLNLKKPEPNQITTDNSGATPLRV